MCRAFLSTRKQTLGKSPVCQTFQQFQGGGVSGATSRAEPHNVPLVLLVLPVQGVNDSQVVKETRLMAAAKYIIMAQSQVQLSATGLEGQNMDRCNVFDCWAEAP